MKKNIMNLFASVMVLVLVLGCASCSLFKNYDYVNEAISKTGALDAVTLEILTDIQATANGTDETLSSAYTVFMNDLQTAAPIFKTKMNVTLYGETVPALVYYEGGYYYIETADERVKLTSDDLLEKTDFLSDWKRTTKPFTEEMLKTAEETDHNDGTKTVTVLIDTAEFEKNYEYLLQTWQNTLAEKYGAKTDAQITVTDTKYAVTIDTESNTVKTFAALCHIDFSGKKEDGETLSVSASLKNTLAYQATGDADASDPPENYQNFELSDGIHYNAYNITKKAIDAARALENLDILITLNSTSKTELATVFIPQTVAVKASGVGTENWKFRDHTEYSVYETEYYNDIYYENGMYYVRTNEGTPDTKYEASDENYQEYCYQANIEQIVCALTQSDLSQAKTVKNEDGTKTVTLTLPAVRFLQTHPDLAEQFRDAMEDPSTFRSSDCEIEITVDRNGNLKLYRMKYIYSGNFVGECDMIMDISVEYYHFGEPVTVEPLEGYETFLTVEEQKEAELAKANTAIENILNADELILYTDLYEDISMGSNVIAYSEKRSKTYGKNLKTKPVYRTSWATDDGEEITEVDIYYENGYFYLWMDENKAKTPESGVPIELKSIDFMKQYLKPISEELKDTAEITNYEDGTSWITVQLSAEELETFLPDLYDMYTEEMLGMPISSIELNDAYLYIDFDENGNFISYEIEYEVSFDVDIQGVMEMEFKHYRQLYFEFEPAGTPVTVTPPANYETFPLELMND